MTKTETIPGTRDFGHRLADCDINFAKTVAGILNASIDDGFKVLREYRKMKVLTRDTANRTWRVKHGAFLDLDTLTRAVAL